MPIERHGPSSVRWLVLCLAMNVVLWGVGLSYYLRGDGLKFTNAAVMIGCLLVCSVGWLMPLLSVGKAAFGGRTVAILLLLLNLGFAVVIAWELPGLQDGRPPP